MTLFTRSRANGRPVLRAALVLVVFVDPVSGQAPVAPPAYAPTAIAPPTSTPTRDQQAAFLQTARITEVRGVKVGTTGTRRATLQAGDVAHDASIQVVDESMARFQSASRVELNFRDYWGYNVAAYRLATRLGLDNVPVSVARRFRSTPAAFTWWVDDVLMDERARLAGQVTPPDRAAWSAQIQVQRVFDELIANTDRNQGNLLIDRQWKLWLIDHSRAFRLNTGLRTPSLVRRCDRQLLAAMKALTRELVDEELGDLLTDGERDALMARRDALVAHLERLGPAALYDWLSARD